MRTFSISVILLLVLSYSPVLGQSAKSDSEEQNILAAREAVWRAWFADDEDTLRSLVPEDVIVISASDEHWKAQAEVFSEAREFHDGGGKLVSLSFPRTAVQHFGDTAFVYSEYQLETSENGKTSISRGRATEVFVRRNGKWVNPGWHTDKK